MASPDIAEDDELGRAFDEDFASWDAEQALSVSEQTDRASSQPLPSGLSDQEAQAKHEALDDSALGLPSEGLAAKCARVSSPSLLSLPREMLLRILSLVPATGLTACACVCTALANLATEDTLWRRLYCTRWGKPSSQARTGGQWKRTYLDADGEEWEATRSRAGCGGSSGAGGSGPGSGGSGDDPGLVSLFLDMLRAKRDTAPDRRLLDVPLQSDPGDIAVKLAAWRRARGFHDPGPGCLGTAADSLAARSRGAAAGGGPSGSATSPSLPGHPRSSSSSSLHDGPPRPDLSAAGRASLTFTRVNPGQQPPVYACDQTGWVHVCGDGCTEGVVEPRSELLVCPVSGQTSDRLVHECEEEEARGGAGGGGEEEAAFGGGFGSFFVAGYECENERALNRLLGYKAL